MPAVTITLTNEQAQRVFKALADLEKFRHPTFPPVNVKTYLKARLVELVRSHEREQFVKNAKESVPEMDLTDA